MLSRIIRITSCTILLSKSGNPRGLFSLLPGLGIMILLTGSHLKVHVLSWWDRILILSSHISSAVVPAVPGVKAPLFFDNLRKANRNRSLLYTSGKILSCGVSGWLLCNFFEFFLYMASRIFTELES